MTLADLIRRFRVLARDGVTPYLWADEDVKDWLNDAQRQAAIRGRLIREDTDATVCQIALTPSTRNYALHESVYEIINARIVPASGTPRTMFVASREWLDAEFPDWRNDTRDAQFIIQDDTRVTVVGAITAGDVLKLEVYRLPMDDMVGDFDEPEIHIAHHEHLIQWALHKAFSIPDADSFDPNRAGLAEAAFTRYFGNLPDSDMRRITREDVPHHNVGVLP